MAITNAESSYLSMVLRVFDDLVGLLPEYTAKTAARDQQCVRDRTQSEGMAFVTMTLPKLGKALERAIEVGSFEPVPEFQKARGRTTPCFMGPFFQRIFDDTGTLVNHADGPMAVRVVRQVCYMLYKLEDDFDEAVIAQSLSDFRETDQELAKFTGEWSREQRLIITIGSNILRRIFAGFDSSDIRPRPGPGASASGTGAHERFEPLVKYPAVHDVYPYYDYFYVGRQHLFDRLRRYRELPVEKEGTSVVRLVPKDSRGPRIICMEPQEFMHLQQGLGDAMRRCIASHPLTRGQVNFTDQNVNRELARKASVDGLMATLDMKEASDRISRVLVAELCALLPDLRKRLLALSCTRTRLPDGSLMEHQKFAPMGSSLCFPVMSVVHFALAVAVQHVATAQPVEALAKKTYVYGDDIIVQSSQARVLFEKFPLFGLRFNETKSFVDGPFRESCGLDAFKGECVTPQRFKKRFLDTVDLAKGDPTHLVAGLRMEYNLRKAGYFNTALHLRKIISHRHGSFPTVFDGSGLLGWITDDPSQVCLADGVGTSFFSRSHQSQYVRARAIVAEPFCSMVGSWERLLRAQLVDQRYSDKVDGRNQRIRIRWKRVPIHAAYWPVKPVYRSWAGA